MRYSFLFFFAFMLGSLFFVKVAEASDNDLCVCQTGTSPKNQVGFFKLGCKVWHIGRSCAKKMTVSFDKSLDEILAENPTVKKLKLSYVGHWSSADESVSFLATSVVPVVKKHDVSITIDNTACLATDNPFKILNFLKSQPEVSGRILFIGNQAISSGLWDKALVGKNNFWAKISGEKLEVVFPSCREFERKECTGLFQDRETGVCLDEKAGKHVTLRCEEGVRTVTRLEPGGKRTTRVQEKFHSWKRSADASPEDAAESLKSLAEQRKYRY